MVKNSLRAFAACVVVFILVMGGYIGRNSLPYFSGDSIKLLPTATPPLLKASLSVENGKDQQIELRSGSTRFLLERRHKAQCDVKAVAHQILGDIDGQTETGKPCLEFSLTITPEEDTTYLKYFKKEPAFPKKFTLASYGLDKEGIMGAGDIGVQLLKLDPLNETPQILVSGFTGGAHCCEVSRLLWRPHHREWRILEVPEQDGDSPITMDIVPDAVPVLHLFHDDGFLYEYGAYFESYAPLQLFAFRKGHLYDVTAQPAYRDLMINDLKSRYDCKAAIKQSYLAYYVASFALLGHLEDAWAYMLLHKDDVSDNSDAAFATHLRDNLVKYGYIKRSAASKLPLKADNLTDAVKVRYRDVSSLFKDMPALLASLPLSCAAPLKNNHD